MLHQWLPLRNLFRESLYLNRFTNTNDNSKWHLRRFGNNNFLKNTRPYSPGWQETIRDQNSRDWRRRLAEPDPNIPSLSESDPFARTSPNNKTVFPAFSGHVSTPNANDQFLVQSFGQAPFFNTPYVFR